MSERKVRDVMRIKTQQRTSQRRERGARRSKSKRRRRGPVEWRAVIERKVESGLSCGREEK